MIRLQSLFSVYFSTLTLIILRNGGETSRAIVNATLAKFSIAELQLRTSNAYLAGTNDLITVLFVGDLAESGPYVMESLSQGEVSTHNFALDKDVGNLKHVIFQNNGEDGWLLMKAVCILNGIYYDLSGDIKWLGNFRIENYDLYIQEPYKKLSFGPTLHLSVIDSFVL